MKSILNRKRIAAQLLKCGINKVWFEPLRLQDIKEAITKDDIRKLIKEGVIKEKPATGISSFRKRKRLEQKRKGRRRSTGSRKGTKNARMSTKRMWINTIRLQRGLLNILKDKKVISSQDYKLLRRKCKGGFFRSKHHLRLYMIEHGILKEYGKK